MICLGLFLIIGKNDIKLICRHQVIYCVTYCNISKCILLQCQILRNRYLLYWRQTIQLKFTKGTLARLYYYPVLLSLLLSRPMVKSMFGEFLAIFGIAESASNWKLSKAYQLINYMNYTNHSFKEGNSQMVS